VTGAPWPLPDGWRWSTLAELVTIDGGRVDAAAIVAGTPYIGLEDMAPGTGRALSRDAVEVGLRGSQRTHEKGVVLYGRLRPYLNKVAVAAAPGVISGEIVPLRSEQVPAAYLAHWLRTPTVVARTSAAAGGAALPRIAPRALLGLPVPVPPANQTQSLVDRLDAAEQLVQDLSASVATLPSIRSSLFLRLAGQQSPTAHEWPPVRVEDMLTPNGLRSGPFGSSLHHAEFAPAGDVAVLGIDNVVTDVFRWAQPRFLDAARLAEFARYRVFPGDVLVTLMGTVGRTAVAPSRLPTSISTKHLAVLTVDKTQVDPYWLAAALRFSPHVADQIGRSQRGVIMSGLNLGIIRRVEVACPPLPLQREYAQAEAVLFALGEDLVAAHRDAEDVLDAVRSRCFGRLNVTTD